MLYVPCIGNSFIQACRYHDPDTMHASIFLTNRRQIKDNRIIWCKVWASLDAWLVAGCSAAVGLQWPVTTARPRQNQTRARAGGWWRGEDSLQPGPSGASSGHTGTVRSGDTEDHDILISCPGGQSLIILSVLSRSYATNKNKKCWNILMGTITNTLKTTFSVENWTNILTVSFINLNGILKLECDQSLNWCSNGANVSVTRRHSVWLAGLGWVWTNHIAGARTPSKSSQW